MLTAFWPQRWSRQQRSNATLVSAVVLMVLALALLGTMLSFLPEPIGSNAQAFSDGARTTLWLTLISGSVGLVLGTGAALARTIGLSEPTVSRLLHGDKLLDPSSKEGELALLLVRVFRSLDALVGTDDQKRLIWMTTHNKALGGVPQQLVQSAAGLVATLNYLDGMRAPA